MNPIYEIRDLKHVYTGKTVLQIQQLAIQPGSIVGLMGPNGSGKSTLLKLLGLIEKPFSGSLLYNGRPVEPFSAEARFSISLLPQEPFMLKRSVFQNVAYGLKLRGAGTGIPEQVHEALSLVDLSGGDFSRRPWYALSGGEAQRVALAARLSLKPKVLLLDEPTASVDAASAQRIKEASLKARREWGTTLIVASHDWQWLHEICDEIHHLFKGRIFGTGRETVIFGPWQQLEAGQWGKILSDRQHLRVSAPPDPEAAAVLEVRFDDGPRSSGGPGSMALQGTVSRLSLERKTGRIFATVLAGDFPFTLRLPPRQDQASALFPGKKVHIRYNIDGIKWI